MQSAGKFTNLIPGGLFGHGEASGVEHGLVIHYKARFAVEGQSKKLVIFRQTLADRGQQIIKIIICLHVVWIVFGQLIDRENPIVAAPDWHFVGPHRHDIERRRAGRHVGRHSGAQFVLGQDNPFQLNIGVRRFEFTGEILHHLHIGIVDGSNRQRDWPVAGSGFRVGGFTGWRRGQPLPGRPDFDSDAKFALSRLRKASVPSRVIMLTARSEITDRVTGLKTGADDYLTKPFAMEELLARVEALGRRGSAAAASDVIKIHDLILDIRSRRLTRAGNPVQLTPREMEILHLLMAEPGRTFSRDEICERIWQREHEYDTRTVEIFIMRIRKKLDEGRSEPLIETVRSMGYRLRTA